MPTNLLEVRQYNFKDGTAILVQLDRHAKKMSFVERDASGNYRPKKWDFSGRELSYMNGWHNILNAMQYVINDCKQVMESWEQEETDKLIEMLDLLGKEGSTNE